MPRNKKPKETVPASAGPPPQQRTTRKPKLDTLIAISNLILTAIVGIGITLYLNHRNEEFQKQLIELQTKAELANLVISYQNGVISLNNLGPATAQDLRLVFCIYSIDTKWLRSIQHISDFDITIDNPALESSTQIKQSLCDATFYGDALQLSIKSFPPQQSLQVQAKPSANISVRTVEVKGDVYMVESSLFKSESSQIWTGRPINWPSSMNEFTGSPLNLALDNYLADNEFKVAEIEISMACQNCNISQGNFAISSFIRKEIRTIAFDDSTADQKIYVRTNNHYYLPEGVNPDPRDDLYLTANVDKEHQIIMEKKDKFEFNPIQTSIPTPAATNTPLPPSLVEIFPQAVDGKVFVFSNEGGVLAPEFVAGEGCVHSGVYGLRLTYNMQGKGNGGWGVHWANPATTTHFDASRFRNLIFWVRGASGGESFQVAMKDTNAKSDLSELVVTVDWSMVSIPLDEFQGVNISSLENVNFSFNQSHGSGSICLDDIAFAP